MTDKCEQCLKDHIIPRCAICESLMEQDREEDMEAMELIEV